MGTAKTLEIVRSLGNPNKAELIDALNRAYDEPKKPHHVAFYVMKDGSEILLRMIVNKVGYPKNTPHELSITCQLWITPFTAIDVEVTYDTNTRTGHMTYQD